MNPAGASVVTPWILLTTLLGSTLVSGIVGAVITNWWGNQREREQRHAAFIEKQLNLFYGPMFALRVEIRSLSETRAAYGDASQQAWTDAMQATEESSAEFRRFVSEDHRPAFERLIEYDNQQFRDVLLPKYREMVGLFREHLWAVDPDTREYFPKLVGFVSAWDRFLAKATPPGAAARVSVSEADLNPLYDNVHRRHDELRAQLSGLKPRPTT